MVKNIFIIRHADANATNGTMIDDIDRTLSTAGIKDASKMGRCLAEKAVRIDKLVTSSASRAFHTGVIISRHVGLATNGIQVREDLYLASVEKILDAVKNCEKECTSMGVVAHNPGVTELAFKTEQFVNVKTSGILYYQAEVENWEDIAVEKLQFKGYMCADMI